MPGPRRLVVLAAAIVLLVATIAFAARGGPGAPGETADGPTGSAGDSSAETGDPAGGSGDGSQDAGSSEDDTSGSGDGADGDGDGDGDGATEARNEPPPTTAPDAQAPRGTKKQPIPGVAPNGELVPVPTDSGPGETLKTSKKGSQQRPPLPKVDTSPLVSTPLPKTASSRGRLVKGFPAKAVPVVPRSKVRSSSVSSSGRALQVALVGSAPARGEAVAAFYRLALAKYGFVESELDAVGGSTAHGFSRSGDSLVLTLTPQGKKRTTYSLYGVLRASGD